MGGGNRRSSKTNRGGKNSKSTPKSGKFEGLKLPNHVESFRKSAGNAIRYSYFIPEAQVGFSSESCIGSDHKDYDFNGLSQITLGDKENSAIDQTPGLKLVHEEITHDYSSDFTLGESSHTGLGFCDEPELTPGGIESSSAKEDDGEMLGLNVVSADQEVSVRMSSSRKGSIEKDPILQDSPPGKNSGYLSIGNSKLYTADVSEEESDEIDFDSADVSEEESDEIDFDFCGVSVDTGFESLGTKKTPKKVIQAIKCRQRMKHRGVDLMQINEELRQMVIAKVDMVTLQPMRNSDCSQVRGLASMYHLHSDRQGSGRKRRVTVRRTENTSLPSSDDDRFRLYRFLTPLLHSASSLWP